MGGDLNFDPDDRKVLSFLVRYALNDIDSDGDGLLLFYLWQTLFEIDRDGTPEDTEKDKEIVDKLKELLVKLDQNNEDSNASDNS